MRSRIQGLLMDGRIAEEARAAAGIPGRRAVEGQATQDDLDRDMLRRVLYNAPIGLNSIDQSWERPEHRMEPPPSAPMPHWAITPDDEIPPARDYNPSEGARAALSLTRDILPVTGSFAAGDRVGGLISEAQTEREYENRMMGERVPYTPGDDEMVESRDSDVPAGLAMLDAATAGFFPWETAAAFGLGSVAKGVGRRAGLLGGSRAARIGGKGATGRLLMEPPVGAGVDSAARTALSPDAPYGVGAMSPTNRAADDARANLSKVLKTDQVANMSKADKAKLVTYRATYPNFSQASRYMTPSELNRVMGQEGTVKKIDRMMTKLPSAPEMAAVMRAGMAKQGWYGASTGAIVHTFGRVDAPRFTALLSSMSPQTSVESNLTNALNVWGNWIKAGRPTSRDEILQIMGASVQGDKGLDSVLDAWVNNTVRSLQADDPIKAVLSGAKVDSFRRNLMDEVFRVTNDAWMAAGMGYNQGFIGGSSTPAQLAKGEPAMSPLYIASSARVRQGAEIAGIHPREGQETAWSFYKAAYELAQKRGKTVKQLLKDGDLTPEHVRETPDFSSLFNEGGNAAILRDAGYGKQLDTLEKYQWPDSSGGIEGVGSKNLDRGAQRLDDLKALRERESRGVGIYSTDDPKAARRGLISMTAEQVPGGGIGHFEGVASAPEQARESFSRGVAGASKDIVTGRNVLHDSLDLETIQPRTGAGLWQPSDVTGGGRRAAAGSPKWRKTPPPQFNPLMVSSFEAPLTKGGEFPVNIQNRGNAAAAITGAFTAQHGTPVGGAVLSPTTGKAQGSHGFVPLEGQATTEGLLDASKIKGVMGIADTGEFGAHVIPEFDGPPLDAKDFVEIGNRLRGGPLDPKKKGRDAVSRTFGSMDKDGLGEYVNYEPDWLQAPGSGSVTRKMFTYLDKLSKKAYAKLDGIEVRQMAEDLHTYYTRKAKSGEFGPAREDLMNMLTIVRDNGLEGLRKAVGSGAFVPTIAAIGLAPVLAKMSAEPGSKS